MKKRIATVIMASLFLFASGVYTAKQTADAATNVHNAYAAVNRRGSELIVEPTTIYEPAKYSDIDGCGATSVVLTPDTSMKVSFEDEANGKGLQTVFNNKLKNSHIPVVRLTKDTVDPFINWMTNTYTVYDIMAISSDIEVIEKLYADEVCYIVNTVYDLTDKTIGSDRYWAWQYIGAANKAGCNILMLDATDPNLSVAAEYISAMSKVTWGYAETELDAVNAIASGCYGVVSTDDEALGNAIRVFNKSGFTRAQYVAAHRGITAYCNEQSLTAVAAGINEGATHLELDIQVTSDRQILICHNADSNATASKNGYYFANSTAAQMRSLRLLDYSEKYQDTFPTLEEVIEVVKDTDVILILELKLDNGSTKAVTELKAIETLKQLMEKHPEMTGRYITISFYCPYAQDMKKYLPEIPVGYLGAGLSGKENDERVTQWGGKHVGMSNVSKKISFLRTYNLAHDEMIYDSNTRKVTADINNTAQAYLARGYVQNGWTYESTLHYEHKINIATTNKAEQCAMNVKTLPATALSMSSAEYESGKVTVAAATYCGWVKNVECEMIELSRTGNQAKVLLYYYQEPSTADGSGYGLYSRIVEVTVA